MIADFVRGRDLYVFFEDGDLEQLEDGDLDGVVENSEDSSVDEGDILFRYEEDLFSSRPGVARYEDDGVPDLEVVIDEGVYSNLVDGEIYDNGVSDYQELPSDATVRFFPPGKYDDFDSTYQALACD